MPTITITSIGADEIERLAPLWQTIHEHHKGIAPTLGPYVDAATSWRVRRDVYETSLGREGFAFIAAEDADVGYALVAIGGDDRLWADTWVVGEQVAELVSLAVVPTARGRGIGTRLLDAVDAELAKRGIDDLVIGVVAGNEKAIRLYERRGLRPTWMVLSRFAARRPGNR